MAGTPQLDISIVEAELDRIFDSFKQTQDLYVQLVCGYEDGSEKNVGRTEVCKNTGRCPKWDERFLCGRGSGKTLKFKVFVDHMWRSPTLCGEAEYDLDMLWARATSRKQKLPIPLYKKGDQTGTMIVTMRLQDNSSSIAPTPMAREAPAPMPREVAQHPQMQQNFQQMPGQMLPRAGVAPQQGIILPERATCEARYDPLSAEQEQQRHANAGALRPTPGQEMNYHMAPHMQPPVPYRLEERRHTQELQRRPEERRQTAQEAPVALPIRGGAAYPQVGGQPHNLAAFAPQQGGYNATANNAVDNTTAPRAGHRGSADQALIPQQVSPNAAGNAAARMQPTQHQPHQNRQLYPQQAQIPTRAEPAARSPLTAPPTSAQTSAPGAPKPAPAPAIGKSGQWWNSFIDRG